MKKIISFVLAFVICMLSCSAAFAEKADISFIDSGTEEIYVVIPEKATELEKHSASLLSERLNKIYGIEARIVPDTAKTSGNIISLGKTVYAKTDFGEKKNGSYAIKAFSGGITIEGSGNRGLIDGVFRFLSEFCDYEVYTKDVIGFTDTKKLSVSAGTFIESSPYFEYRKVDTASSYDAEYARANSLNSNVYFSNDNGGIIEYLTLFGHSLTNQFCKRDEYFGEHPEYFALRDGKRISDQLCLTNPEVLEIVKKEILDILKERHDPTADLQIVSLTQDDNQNYCTCEKCAALDEKNGSHAGTMLTFVNAVADAVKEAGYDNVAVDTFAYQYTRACPTQIVPRDNVIIRLCSIECCFGHPIDDPDCKENIEFLKDLSNWSKACSRVYIWDYVNNYSETFLPFANFQVLQRNMQIFYENGAKGVYEEGNYYMHICNGEFYELRSFLLSKLMQNPYREDYEELMIDYLLNVYGPGGTYLKDFIDLITKRSVTKQKHLHIRQQPGECLPGITPSEIRAADKMWENAKNAALTEQQLKEVERSELCWQYWKCCRMKMEYSPFRGIYHYMNEHKKLYEKIVDFGNIAVGEGGIKYLRPNTFSIYFLSPTKWESKYDGKFWHKLDPIADKIYDFLDGIFGEKN